MFVPVRDGARAERSGGGQARQEISAGAREPEERIITEIRAFISFLCEGKGGREPKALLTV